MKKLFIFLLLMIFVGCKSDQEIKRLNIQTLSESGDYIGKLSDGRVIVRYRIETISGMPTHYVYVCNGSTTVNHDHDSNGNRVEVFIDGVKYIAEKEQK
jgi:uncharacterized protein YcfL